MDYTRIYREFIADRRLKEPALTGYTESHHILPRCMGGDDSEANLIALTAEDHFFAHLVLAKATDDWRMWGTIVLMLKGNRWNRRRSDRLGFGRWRRAAKLRQQGMSHPRADQGTRTFYHVDGGVFEGARIELSARYNVPAASVNRLVQGRCEVAYGRALRPITAKEVLEAKRERASLGGIAALRGVPKDLRTHALRDEFDSRMFEDVAAGRRGGCKGWHIEGTPEPRAMGKMLTLVHSDGRRLTGVQADLARALDVSPMALVRLKRNPQFKCRGFRLVRQGAVDAPGPTQAEEAIAA